MTRQAMEQAFDELPEGAARLLAPARPILIDAAEDIPEDVIGIVCASPHISGNSAMVITSTRIVEVTTGGAIQILPYSEISGVRSVGGKKKRFGGYEAMYLLVDSMAGGTRTYPLFGDHDWNARIGAAAESAHRKFRLKTT
jgi:hypothetical protein